MIVYTSQIAKAKNHPNFLDVTVKSGNKAFAPTWKIVIDLKNRDITKKEYITKYVQLMRESFKNNREEWYQLISQTEVVVCCYCKAGEFCHRYILVNILRELCKKKGIKFEYRGEV